MAGNFLKRFQSGYTDVVGIDLGGVATKAVRVKKTKEGISVVAADVLPRVVLPGGSAENPAASSPLHLSKSLRGRHVALAVSSPAAVVKLFTFPAHSDKTTDTHVIESLGLGNPADYRVAYEPVSETRTDIKVLAIALPDTVAHAACDVFPAGLPAPCSVELTGLASLTAYTRGPGAQNRDQYVAVLDFGGTGTTAVFINKGAVALIRRFDFGTGGILKRIQETLGVEADVALGILTEGSFDISKVMHQAMEPFLQQLVIAWDFIERRENTHVTKLFVCGGAAGLRSWSEEVRKATGLEPEFWNPFAGFLVEPGGLPERLQGQESRFSAALGAALGVMGAP